MMQLEAGIPVVLAKTFAGLKIVPGSQEQTLISYNRDYNDEQLGKAVVWLDRKYGDGFCISRLGTPLIVKEMLEYYKEEIRKRNSVISRQNQEIEILRFDIYEAWNSASMRIGRVITCPGRKIRDLLKKKV